MKQKYLYIFSVIATLLLAACNEDDVISREDTSMAVELTDIKAVIADGSPIVSRADEHKPALGRYVGRGLNKDFARGDRMVFTSIRRTEHPISLYTYKDIEYYFDQDDGSLKRDKGKGSIGDGTTTAPDKIYWSDAKNNHTFIGYSCPNVAGFDWNCKAESGVDVYYGSLGNATATTTADYIDYNDTENGNALISNDDILLSYDIAKVADNAVAYIEFYHGLALVRVQVSLSGFASGEDKKDIEAIASDMVFKNMPTMYKWLEGPCNTRALVEGDQIVLNDFNWGTDKTAPAWDQKKDVHFWCPEPHGDAPKKTNNTFTFYALAVPRTEVNGQRVEFNVTYPKPMKPTETETNNYSATLPDNIEFRAGHCTTITIHLDHKNEKITIGAEYIDWEFDATPDDGSLKKNSTFLRQSDMSKVTIADGSNVTIDNATWLFKGASTKVYDIYQNDGTAAHPYQIRTAAQLYSFAKEVNNGRTFEGQYISLDAGLYLQASITDTGLEWPGIGTAEHPFQGTFIGGMRRISRLQGNSLFASIGDKGHVGQILLEDVISIKNGRGALADTNAGIIDACKVESRSDNILIVHTSGTTDYAGALCGINNGMIVACYALGSYCGNATTVGGIVGKNTGSVVASYAAMQTTTVDQLTDTEKTGITAGTGTITTTLGGVVGEGNCQYSFYCNELITSSRGGSEPATGMTATAMQKDSFVGSTADTNTEPTNLNGAIHQWCLTDTWPTGFDKDAEYSPEVKDGNGTIVSPAVKLSEHINSIKYISLVASFPKLDDSQ